MVMGRCCCVRDGLKYIAVEFDILCAVAHAGGRHVRGFGFFGGSNNGYWNYDTLVETGMDEGMLTKDGDSSFRAQAADNRITYDSTIVSYEESPPDFSALFKQRLRWSQGWLEASFDSAPLSFIGWYGG
jgi:cellulose synthase/poly-beta-1,6-N-acetylglucosamine synthase-like glycosyltransferase